MSESTTRLQRSDATRNRERILLAAEELYAVRPALEVSMDEVADAAGVGKGTVYRRFGNRAGLAEALLDRKERALQEAVLEGPPPLGPDGEPEERLRSFLYRILDLVIEHQDLHILAGGPTLDRYRKPLYQFYVTHIRMLIEQLAPAADATFLSHALLASLDAVLCAYLRVDENLGRSRIRTGLDQLVEGISRISSEP